MSESKKTATKKEWFGMAVIALPCILYSMDLTVLNLAVPKLSADLHPTSTQLLWIVDIYGFLLAGFLITMGSLGDRIGRRKLLMIGAVFFGLASLLAAFAARAEMLILARAFLGIAGATLAPSTLSLIRNMFQDEKERTTAIAIWITSFSLGGGIGPIVGGILLEYYWWGSVFLVAIPLMLLILITAPFLLPEYKNPNPVKIDFISSLMSLGMVLAVIYGVKNFSQNGFTWVASAACIVGVFTSFLFIKRQQKLPEPFLDLNLFKMPNFGAWLGTYMFSTFVLFGMFFFIAQYLQLVLGLSPLHAGLWTLPSFVGFIVGSMTTPRLSGKFQARYLMLSGLLLAAVGFALLITLKAENNLAIVVTALSLFSLGIAPVFTLATDMIVGSAPPDRAGSAASISETASELGGALGIAILGSIGTYVYGQYMNGHAVPNKATDTLGGVVAYVSTIPDEQATELLSLAKSAFTNGINWVGGIAALITLSLAIVCLISHHKQKE